MLPGVDDVALPFVDIGVYLGVAAADPTGVFLAEPYDELRPEDPATPALPCGGPPSALMGVLKSRDDADRGCPPLS